MEDLGDEKVDHYCTTIYSSGTYINDAHFLGGGGIGKKLNKFSSSFILRVFVWKQYKVTLSTVDKTLIASWQAAHRFRIKTATLCFS